MTPYMKRAAAQEVKREITVRAFMMDGTLVIRSDELKMGVPGPSKRRSECRLKSQDIGSLKTINISTGIRSSSCLGAALSRLLGSILRSSPTHLQDNP